MIQWTDLFEAYLLEAKWYHSGYKPNLKEYLDNAWISITGPVVLTHSYFLTATSFTDEALQSIRNYPKIVRLAATILRIADDMGTSYVRTTVCRSYIIKSYVHSMLIYFNNNFQ